MLRLKGVGRSGRAVGIGGFRAGLGATFCLGFGLPDDRVKQILNFLL